MPVTEHFTWTSIISVYAPGAKTRQKCPWWVGFEPHQVRKQAKGAPGGQVLSPTRCEIGGKVRLVVVVKEYELSQSPHSKHFTKLLPSLTKAPGAKIRQKCAWWAGFEPHQVQKPGKSAPGGQVLGPTRYENRPKVRLVVVLKKRGFCQSPHPKHLTNSLPSLPKAPGTKTPQKRAWWAGFRPHQVRNRG
jgi:hypothetical protein